MRIQLCSVLVEDQTNALDFYTRVLGFIKRADFPVAPGEDDRWLTVVSPEGPKDVELVLEPNRNPAAKTYQKALFEQGIPATAFAVDDVEAEHRRLVELGVKFRSGPTAAGPVTIAVFDDTCGNWIQIYQIA